MTIESIVGNKWSAKAAAADALDRVNDGDQFCAVWIGADGKLHYSKSNTDAPSLSLMSVTFAELAQSIVRDALYE